MTRLSVIIVAHNESRCIRDCLQGIKDGLLQPHEVIVVDGCSTDSTVEVCRSFQAGYPLLQIVENKDPQQTITKNRNIGLQHASGEYIAFTDADCVVPPDWLQVLLRALTESQNPKLVGVGGTNIAPAEAPPVTQAISAVQNSRLGFVGSAQGARFATPVTVRSLSCTNVVYKKTAVDAVGGFREELGNMGEDYELGYRLRQAGWELLFLPSSIVRHNFRTTWAAFARNMYRYGQGRMKLIRILPERPLKYFLPFAFLAVMLVSFGLAPFFPWFWVIPIGYFAGVLVESIRIRSRRTRMIDICRGFIILHWSYAWGMWGGLFRA